MFICHLFKYAKFVWWVVFVFFLHLDMASMNEETYEFDESTSSVYKRTRCRTSTVWSEFELQPISDDVQQKTKCKRCHCTYTAGDNETTNLLRHVKKCLKRDNDDDEIIVYVALLLE